MPLSISGNQKSRESFKNNAVNQDKNEGQNAIIGKEADHITTKSESITPVVNESSELRSNEEAISYSPDECDNSSIDTVSDLFSESAASSVSSVEKLSDVSDELARLLFRDYGLKALCKDGFEKTDPDDYENHLRKLLKCFSKQLHREKANELEAVSARWFSNHTRSFVRIIRNLFNTRTIQKYLYMEAALKKPVDKKYLIESYLSQFIDPNAGIDASDLDVASDHSVSEDHFDWSSLPNLHLVERFIYNSKALSELKKSLMRFVISKLLPAQDSLKNQEIVIHQELELFEAVKRLHVIVEKFIRRCKTF